MRIRLILICVIVNEMYQTRKIWDTQESIINLVQQSAGYVQRKKYALFALLVRNEVTKIWATQSTPIGCDVTAP